jgi:protein-tyrosine phosphatase
VFNLCGKKRFIFHSINQKVTIIHSDFEEEKVYDGKYFNFSVERFPVNDYDVPSLKKALAFVEKLSNEQITYPNRVNVFHCMGGKGRTGTICSMFLLYSGICQNAEVFHSLWCKINICIYYEMHKLRMRCDFSHLKEPQGTKPTTLKVLKLRLR